MPMTEDRALEILSELIKKPDTNASAIPEIWASLINTYNQNFAPLAEPAKKKRRKRGTSPNAGWPAGVTRAEYAEWKAKQLANGVTGGINPQEYARQREVFGRMEAVDAAAKTARKAITVIPGKKSSPPKKKKGADPSGRRTGVRPRMGVEPRFRGARVA